MKKPKNTTDSRVQSVFEIPKGYNSNGWKIEEKSLVSKETKNDLDMILESNSVPEVIKKLNSIEDKLDLISDKLVINKQ